MSPRLALEQRLLIFVYHHSLVFKYQRYILIALLERLISKVAAQVVDLSFKNKHSADTDSGLGRAL